MLLPTLSLSSWDIFGLYIAPIWQGLQHPTQDFSGETQLALSEEQLLLQMDFCVCCNNSLWLQAPSDGGHQPNEMIQTARHFPEKSLQGFEILEQKAIFL